ncbi:MAG: hypothetical protein HY080_16195 [Gammaproteobacteria bacterium]|nr:hypothetical protein [Gammaproteobacteria bacterium]
MKESLDNLQKSYELSRQSNNDVINPLQVAALFEQEQISYTLIGGHMLSYYTGVTRATVDVDFLIRNADFSRAVSLMQQHYSQFDYKDKVFHVTFDARDQSSTEPERIDLVKDGFALFREIVNRHSVTRHAGKHKIRIPTREAAIALKFAATISPNRQEENKSVDLADLIRLIKTAADLDEAVIVNLGELVYQGGGRELIDVVVSVRSGRPVNL